MPFECKICYKQVRDENRAVHFREHEKKRSEEEINIIHSRIKAGRLKRKRVSSESVHQSGEASVTITTTPTPATKTTTTTALPTKKPTTITSAEITGQCISRTVTEETLSAAPQTVNHENNGIDTLQSFDFDDSNFEANENQEEGGYEEELVYLYSDSTTFTVTDPKRNRLGVDQKNHELYKIFEDDNIKQGTIDKIIAWYNNQKSKGKQKL